MIANLGFHEQSKRATIVWEDSVVPTTISVSKNGAALVAATNPVGSVVVVSVGQLFSFILEPSDTNVVGPLIVQIVGGITTVLMIQIRKLVIEIQDNLARTVAMDIKNHTTTSTVALDKRTTGLVRDIVGVGIEDIKSKIKHENSRKQTT